MYSTTALYTATAFKTSEPCFGYHSKYYDNTQLVNLTEMCISAGVSQTTGSTHMLFNIQL
jgi:hypothetical protein